MTMMMMMMTTMMHVLSGLRIALALHPHCRYESSCCVSTTEVVCTQMHFRVTLWVQNIASDAVGAKRAILVTLTLWLQNMAR